MDKKPTHPEKKHDHKKILRRRGNEEVVFDPNDESPSLEHLEAAAPEDSTPPHPTSKLRLPRRTLNKRARKVRPAELPEEIQKKLQEGESPEIPLHKLLAKEAQMAAKKRTPLHTSARKAPKHKTPKHKAANPEATPKRRGRPPKEKSSASAIQSFLNNPERFSQDTNALVDLVRKIDPSPSHIAPKKRGRPPKNATHLRGLFATETPLSEQTHHESTEIQPNEGTDPSTDALLASSLGTPANAVSNPPKKRGRPKKQPTLETSVASTVTTFSDETTAQDSSPALSTTPETPKKRGRGRPKKSESLAARTSVPTLQKRGPGRPRKTETGAPQHDATALSSSALDAPKKRGRGRPKKAESLAAKTPVSPLQKRGRGRPRKSESLQSLPAATSASSANLEAAVVAEPSVDFSSTPQEAPKKRGPGRPRKTENLVALGAGDAPKKRGPGRPRKADVLQRQRTQALKGVGPGQAITFRALQTQLEALQAWRNKDESVRLRVRKALEGSAKRTDDSDYRDVVESLIFRMLYPEEHNS